MRRIVRRSRIRSPDFPREKQVVRALPPPLHARRAIHGPGGLFLVLHRAAGQFLYLMQVSKNPLQPELCQRVLSFRAAPLEEAQQVITRIEPQQLRDSVRLRQMVARDFEQIQASVGDLLVDRPRRNILRRGQTGAGV